MSFFSTSSVLLTCLELARIALPLAMLGIGLYALILFPQKLQQKYQKSLQESLKLDAWVVTRDGQKGRVCQIADYFIILHLEDGRKIEISLDAVERVDGQA